MQTSAAGCMIPCRQMANIKWITLDDLSQGWENLCNKLVKSDNQSSLTEKGNWRKSCFFVFFGLLHCFCCNGQKHFIQQSWHHNKGIPLNGLPLFFRSRKFYIWERGGGCWVPCSWFSLCSCAHPNYYFHTFSGKWVYTPVLWGYPVFSVLNPGFAVGFRVRFLWPGFEFRSFCWNLHKN